MRRTLRAGSGRAGRSEQAAGLIELGRPKPLLDPDKIAIDTHAYDSFSSVGASEAVFDTNGNGVLDAGESFDDKNGDGIQQISTGTSSLGGAGEVVVYQVVYKWKGLTPLMTKTVGEITLRANLPVKNEVF